MGRAARTTTRTKRDGKLLNVAAVARIIDSLAPAIPTADTRRQMVADLCRFIGRRIGAVKPHGVADQSISPRMRQTLERLLAGDSEKQVAQRLRLSPHTVHIYVKALYRHFDVSSRGELLAKRLGETAVTPAAATPPRR